jgi:hypothetical protein
MQQSPQLIVVGTGVSGVGVSQKRLTKKALTSFTESIIIGPRVPATCGTSEEEVMGYAS